MKRPETGGACLAADQLDKLAVDARAHLGRVVRRYGPRSAQALRAESAVAQIDRARHRG